MQTTHPEYIYKITTRDLWEDAQKSGIVGGMPIDIADGYMHFSTLEQLLETLRLHFKGQSDLVLLAVKNADVKSDLKWEPSRGGELFPHLYSSLGTDLIGRSAHISVGEDGVANLPEDFAC